MNKFIIPSEPQNLTTINYEDLMRIENKILTNNKLTQLEVETFLDYLVYMVRIKLDEDFTNATYKNLCNRAQCMIHYYLEDLNVEHYLNRSFDSITKDAVDHSFVVAIFNAEDYSLPYIIDPTYRQFFETERCKKRPLTPGNFILEKNKKIIVNFLQKGYMKMNKKNTEIYGNSLYFTSPTIPKPVLPISGDIFAKTFLKGHAVISKSRRALVKEGLYIQPLVSQNKDLVIKKRK